MNVPGNMTANATSVNGAIVTYNVNASDPKYTPNQLTITCSPDSGATFPIGTTQVNCTATNLDSHTDSNSFNVVVQDNKPPVLKVPGHITVNASTSLARQ